MPVHTTGYNFPVVEAANHKRINQIVSLVDMKVFMAILQYSQLHPYHIKWNQTKNLSFFLSKLHSPISIATINRLTCYNN